MMPWNEPATVILLITVVFLGFYIAGTVAGRRRVTMLYNNVREAVNEVGGRVVDGRCGTTTAIVSCKRMGVLTEFSVVIGVLTWSNPLTYLINKLLGRSDLVILRARLSKTPTTSFTLIKRDSPARRYAIRWGSVLDEVDGYLVVVREEGFDEKLVKEVLEKVKGFESVSLLSVSKELPHLQLYFTPDETGRIKALFSALEKLI